MDVYTLSVLFKIRRLEFLCVEYFNAAINIDNVLIALKNANRLKLDFIKESCMKFIIKENNYSPLVMSSDFENLSKELMVEIVRRKQMPTTRHIEGSFQTLVYSKSSLNLGTSLEQDFEEFLKTGGLEFADIYLNVNNTIIPSHKAILASRCSYFEAMFRSFMPPKNEHVNIKIGEIVPSIQSFHTLLKYIYYGHVNMPLEDSLYLLSAPSFYSFTNNRFQVFCKQNLETTVKVENVLQVLEASEEIKAIEMKKHALNLIVNDFSKVAKLSNLRRLSKDLLLDILQALGEEKSNDTNITVPNDITHFMSI